MDYSNRPLQLVFIFLALTISSCSSVTQNPPSYPNSALTRTETPVIVSSPTSRKFSTQTATLDLNNVTPEWLITPTIDPEAFTSNAEIAQGNSQEDVARILFSKWLDHYLSENISPATRLDEYKIEKIIIPIDQYCARKSGGIFVAEAGITMKTTLPILSSTGGRHSDWTSGGGNTIDSYHQFKSFHGVIYQSGNNYKLEVIIQNPVCD